MPDPSLPDVFRKAATLLTPTKGSEDIYLAHVPRGMRR